MSKLNQTRNFMRPAKSFKRATERSYQTLESLKLTQFANRPALELAHGEVLMLDEPSEGLRDNEKIHKKYLAV
jgi:ABC-type branched-subunit amino acid transport system ATPase component